MWEAAFMSGTLIGLLMAVCIVCYTGQTFFNKLFSAAYDGPDAAVTPVYAALYGLLVCAVTLCLSGFRFSPSPGTLALGCANGVLLFLYNLGMIHAARTGPYAFQSIVMLFGSIVVCLVFSAVCWGDRLTGAQLAGIAVMLGAFVVLNSGGVDFRGVKRGYFFWVILLFFSNGFYGVLMDAQQRLFGQERNEMIVVTFFSSAVISLLYLLAVQRGRIMPAFQMSRRAWGLAVGSGLCAAFAIYLLMLLLRYVPSYILYTVNNGSILVLSALLCGVVLKERVTRMTAVGVVLCIISIVLLSL